MILRKMETNHRAGFSPRFEKRSLQTMNTRWLLIVALVSAVVAGCSTTPYKTDFDYDPEVVFTNYRTWAWIDETPMAVTEGGGPSPLLEGRIMSLVEAEMAMKGFRKVDDVADADMAISFTVGSRDKIKVNSYPSTFQAGYSTWGAGWGYGYNYGYPAREVDVRQYTEGQLAIDVFDVKQRRPVYHGFATGNVRDRSREERDELLRQVVKSILLTFPPA
jgi:hypothetical protein